MYTNIVLIVVFNMTMIFTTIIIASLLYFVLFCGFLYFIKNHHHHAWRFPALYNACVNIFICLPGNGKFLGERPAIIAPPESEWYHGRLDRYSAESRLRGSSKLGSYLGEFDLFIYTNFLILYHSFIRKFIVQAN